MNGEASCAADFILKIMRKKRETKLSPQKALFTGLAFPAHRAILTAAATGGFAFFLIAHQVNNYRRYNDKQNSANYNRRKVRR